MSREDKLKVRFLEYSKSSQWVGWLVARQGGVPIARVGRADRKPLRTLAVVEGPVAQAVAGVSGERGDSDHLDPARI